MHNLINSLRHDYFYNFILEGIGRYIWSSQEVSSLELEEKNSQNPIRRRTQVGYGKTNLFAAPRTMREPIYSQTYEAEASLKSPPAETHKDSNKHRWASEGCPRTNLGEKPGSVFSTKTITAGNLYIPHGLVVHLS